MNYDVINTDGWLQDIASKLEQAASNSEVSEFKIRYTELNAAFNALKTSLSQYQNQIGNSP